MAIGGVQAAQGSRHDASEDEPRRFGDRGGTTVEFTVREYSFRGGYYRLVVDHDAGLELAFELVSESSEPVQPRSVTNSDAAVASIPDG